eukprot:7599859-Ditylum_brightwellii.AAC.1
MVGKNRNTSTLCKKKTRKQKPLKDMNAMVESQEGNTKSDKESVASKSTCKGKDVKVPGKDQEYSSAKKGVGRLEGKNQNQDGAPETKKPKKRGRNPPTLTAQ